MREAMENGESPLGQISPEHMEQAVSFYNRTARNVAKWWGSPEGLYLAQVSQEGGVAISRLTKMPSELLEMSQPIAWEPTEIQKQESRQEMMGYLAALRASGAPSNFTGYGLSGRYGRGKSKLNAAEQLNLAALKPEEIEMRVQFFNRHANAGAILNALVSPELTGGETPAIKTPLLLGAEQATLKVLQSDFKGIQAHHFMLDECSRREFAELVAYVIRRSSAISGSGVLVRVTDDVRAAIREMACTIYLHHRQCR